jgi:hypothetical protein
MGPLIIAILCGVSALASIEYRSGDIPFGKPSTGVNGKDGFKGSTVPAANTSYDSWIKRIKGQQAKLNLPGEELGDGG